MLWTRSIPMGQVETKKKEVLFGLQYLRAFAAIAVVYGHSTIQVEAYESFLNEIGIFGVDLFFILSGFIMVYITKESTRPGEFLKKRISRVVPLYWFFTFLMAALLLVLPSVFKGASFDLVATVKSLFFIPVFSISKAGFVWPILPPGWTLNYEMYFYAVFAITLVFTRKFCAEIVGGIVILIWLLFGWFGMDGAISIFYKSPIIFEFCMGMAICRLYQSKFTMPRWLAAILVVGGIIALLSVGSVVREDLPYHGLLYFGFSSAAIVIGTLYLKLGKINWLLLLGDASYSIYLVHIFILGFCRWVIPKFLGESLTGAIIFSIITVIGSVACGIFVHFFIDQWFLNHVRSGIKKLLGRSQTVAHKR